MEPEACRCKQRRAGDNMSTEGGFLLFPHRSFLSISDRVMRLPLPPPSSLLLYWRDRRWFPHIKTPAEDKSCYYKYNPADKVEIMIINKQQMCFKIQVMEE